MSLSKMKFEKKIKNQVFKTNGRKKMMNSTIKSKQCVFICGHVIILIGIWGQAGSRELDNKTKINKKTKTKRNFENMPKWEPE
jgi:hypothetical protein